MIVCVAEKPSVAREIAGVLGATTKRQGYLEGNGYQVTWTFGHLCTLKEPHDYSPQWKTWMLSSLPMIPPRFGIKLIDNEVYTQQFGIIRTLMQNADEIINCGDAGQEGELIQRWVMLKAGVKCPVKRLWAIGDWILGMNATRLYTLRYAGNRQVLSIGRVQTPTLAMIVNRQDEIDHFVPSPYWELKTVYRDVTFTASKGKSEDKETGEKLLAEVTGKEFTVTGVTEKKGKEAPPRLFDLTSLQVECNRKYGFSADETLKLIQSLYEKKVTTYPRVDTTFLSDDIYPKVPKILSGLKGYEEFTSPLSGRKLPKSKKVFDNSKVTDHHAIIPTGVPATALTPEERKVYDLVAGRFIAAFYPDCEISTTTVTGKVSGIDFKTSGKRMLKPGWRVLFSSDQNRNSQSDAGEIQDARQLPDNDGADSKDETNAVLPEFTAGESGPHSPFLKEIWTTPPKPFTEATLLRAMETAGKAVENEELRDALKENGIGRPSTRAAIIETLYKRNYIRKERKSLYPTQTGKDLIATIHEELLKSAELTGMWEKKLRMIESGTYQASAFLDELKSMVRTIVINVLSEN